MKVDLASIKARLSKASPGPWAVHQPRIYPYVVATDSDGIIQDRIARLDWSDDAEFIAHARTDVADLVAEVEALLEAMERKA